MRFFVWSDFAKSTQLAPDSWSIAVLNIDSNSLRYSTFKVLLGYRPLQQIWLCAMGHFGISGFVLRATTANLIVRYGLLRRIWSYAMGHCVELIHSTNLWWCLHNGTKHRIWLFAMGHSARLGYALWAVAQELVLCYGPSTEFDYALWAIVPNQLPERKLHNKFLKTCQFL